MVFCYAKKLRRLAAQVLAADADEIRALRQRLLPRHADQAAPLLRIASEADRSAAPAAILSAVLADEITAEEAEHLMQQAERAQVPTQAQGQRPYWIEPPPELAHLSPEELSQMGYLWRPELDPLAAAIRRWGAGIQDDRLVRVDRTPGEPSRCGAASQRTAPVNNSGNTSATPDGDAAGGGGDAAMPL